MRAVSRGYRTKKAIAKAARLTEVKTQTYLTRLQHRGLVESEKSSDPEERARHIKHYHMKGLRIFLLQKVWR